ncbi:MAG: hypothetical protein RIK87_00455 [Fuerstiella sp.]
MTPELMDIDRGWPIPAESSARTPSTRVCSTLDEQSAPAARLVVIDADSGQAARYVFEDASDHRVSVAARLSAAQLCDASGGAASGAEDADVVIVFLDTSRAADAVLRGLLNAIVEVHPQKVCLVTSCAAHLHVSPAIETEDRVCRRLRAHGCSVSVIRTGHLLVSGSRTARWAQKLSWLAPLLSTGLRSCFVRTAELEECLAAECGADKRPETDFADSKLQTARSSENDTRGERADPADSVRIITLLGCNESWRSVLEAYSGASPLHQVLRTIMLILSRAGLGLFIRLMVRCATGMMPRLRRWNFDTLYPQDEQELLSLCHHRNRQHVVIAGYNNGVNHFGWRHVGCTVVPTIQTGRRIRLDGDQLTVDAGLTLKRCRTFLDDYEADTGDSEQMSGYEFYVVPNYSYISMGTVFFVPVHGSGSDVSTLGDTIEWVRMYDPARDQVVEATRGETVFDNTMYNMHSGMVLLQLRFRLKPRCRYFMKEFQLDNPSASNIWQLFHDPEPSNIEIRRSRAADSTVQVRKYYPSESRDPDRLLVPRDRLGSLWDRLEENAITAFLFHWLVRRWAWHVELFLNEHEFGIFWSHIQQLPLSKIQLRFVRSDGMTHSPVRDHDCVSADLIMWRRHRHMFQEFLRSQLPHVKLNPGKQTR